MSYWEAASELAQPNSEGGFKIFRNIFEKQNFSVLDSDASERRLPREKSAGGFNSEFRNLGGSLGTGGDETLLLDEGIFYVLIIRSMSTEPAELSYCVYCLF